MSKSAFRLRVALRSSLWIIPALTVAGAAVLASGLLYLDTAIDDEIAARWPWLVDLSAEGARSILTAIAGSMITVAGVVFSITMVVLSLAASQYTSRVLRNFMRDRTTQVVLGVFVGVFAYCLLVLGQVHSNDGEAYVPILAMLGGVILAFVAIAYLIYFIHHVARSIQASEILSRAARETYKALDELFPESMGETAEDEGDPQDSSSRIRQWRSVPALSTGYVQTVEAEKLLELAASRDTVIRMECGIGQFAIAGSPLVSVPASIEVDDELIEEANDCYALDTQRTIEQDPGFGIRQITDIALRALSPGVNDTTTAVMCLDYSASIMARLACRRIPSHYRFLDGRLRVIARGPDFADLLAEAATQIRHNASGNTAVLMKLFHLLQTLETMTSQPGRRRILLTHAAATLEVVQRTVAPTPERQELEAKGREVIVSLESSKPATEPSRGVGHSFVGTTLRDGSELRRR